MAGGVLLALLALVVLLLRKDRPADPAVEPQKPVARQQPVAPSAPPEPEGTEPLAPLHESAAAAPHGELAGRVISAQTRDGIAGAEVTWGSPSGAALSSRTDGQGRFSFQPPEAGTWQLASARADGHLAFGPEWGKSPLTVVFRPGERVRGVVVELVPARELTGRVLDATGNRVSGAAVRVLVPRKDEAVLFPLRDRFTTDAQGELKFVAEPGAVLEAQHPTAGSGSATVEEQQREVVVTLEPFPPDAGPRASLSGRVVSGGHGVPGALVHVASALRAYPRVFGAQDGYRELTDDEGRFEVSGLERGTYDVSAQQLGLAPAHRFDVKVPAKALELELGRGPTLSGRVTDEAGAAVPAFTVRLEWRKAALERLSVVEARFVDPEGRYRIEGVAAGMYVLEVDALGFNPGSTDVTLSTNDAVADVKLERGVRVTGTVRTEGTRAVVPGARVGLEGAGAPATLTDIDGAFTLDGLPRRGFSLEASAEGHNTRVVTVTEASAALDIELSEVTPDAGRKVELVGIGCVLRGRNDALVIGMVMEGGGASGAGLKPGDEISAVDGKSVAALGFEPSIRAIRGPAASVVELQVRTQGEQPARAVSVTRRKVSN